MLRQPSKLAAKTNSHLFQKNLIDNIYLVFIFLVKVEHFIKVMRWLLSGVGRAESGENSAQSSRLPVAYFLQHSTKTNRRWRENQCLDYTKSNRSNENNLIT